MANLRIDGGANMVVRVYRDFHLLNDTLFLTAGYHCFIYKQDNELRVDADFCDVSNVKFMGKEIEQGYDYRTWKEDMLKVDINIPELLDKECDNPTIISSIETMLKEAYGGNKF